MRVYFKTNKMDYPKKINDLQLNWYQQGKICIAKNRNKPPVQTQNIQIKRINQIVKQLWEELNPGFKKDLSDYAHSYKLQYPSLRKRGVSSYSCFLILIHSLIKRFNLKERSDELLYKILKDLLSQFSIYQAVRLKLMKRVADVYQLNQPAIYKDISHNFIIDKMQNERIIITNRNVTQYNAIKYHKCADDG